MINMGTQGNGNKTKRTVKDSISILMVRNMKVDGLKIKKKEKGYIDIGMVMFMMEIGKMIEDKEKEQ
jgi:hypothetical protein